MQNLKKFAFFGAITLIVVLAGGGLMVQQVQRVKAEAEKKIEDLERRVQQVAAERDLHQNQVQQLKTEKAEVEKKHCKGIWKTDTCIYQTCTDSDGAEGKNAIFVKGTVIYTDLQGVQVTAVDECISKGRQVNEFYCYESPSESGNFIHGKNAHHCLTRQCVDGACVKKKGKK